MITLIVLLLSQASTYALETQAQEDFREVMVSMGVESSGGGSIVLLENRSPILLDFFVHGVGKEAVPQKGEQITKDGSLRLQDLKLVSAYLTEHLYALFPYRPFFTYRILQALFDLEFIVRDKRIRLNSVAHCSDPICKGLRLAHVIEFDPLRGTFIDPFYWNQLDLKNQAGLLVHEALRVLQFHDRAISLDPKGESSLNLLTAMTFARPPSDPILASLEDPDRFQVGTDFRERLELYHSVSSPETIRDLLARTCAAIGIHPVSKEFRSFLCKPKNYYLFLPPPFPGAASFSAEIKNWQESALWGQTDPLGSFRGWLGVFSTFRTVFLVHGGSSHNVRQKRLTLYKVLGPDVAPTKEQFPLLFESIASLIVELKEVTLSRIGRHRSGEVKEVDEKHFVGLRESVLAICDFDESKSECKPRVYGENLKERLATLFRSLRGFSKALAELQQEL